MPTAATDRLDLLFANKPRPTKPTLSNTTVNEPLDPKLEPHKPDIKGFEDHSVLQNQITSSSAQVVTEVSDEDDEYTSLFAKKPKKNKENRSTKAQYKRSDDPAQLEDVQSQSAGKIEFLPSGKVSAEKLGSKRVQENDRELIDDCIENNRPLAGRFCPLNLVAKLPYKYMKDPDDQVSKRFFASNKFYQRKWSLYYLHPPESFNKKALVLVPFDETQKFINEISTAFKIQTSVPPFPFTLDFYSDGTPNPIILGISSSREDVNDLTETIPAMERDHGECPSAASAGLKKAFESFRNKMEGVVLAMRAKNTSSGQNKAQKLLQTLQEARNQMNRAQRYLGLRPRSRPIELSSGLTWNEEQRSRAEKYDSCNLSFNFLDVTEVVEHPSEHQPIIISIDVEAYERNHDIVTEIGISTLDTLDLAELAPGQNGENWVKQIRSRHFRIKGREHFVNKDFCVGNADAFQFGTSEHVELVAVSDAIDSCFEWPFSVQYKKEGPSVVSPSPSTHTEEASHPTIDPQITQKGSKDRNFVILGHDVGIDLEYLQKLGSEVFNPLSTTTDTAPADKSSPASKRHQVLCSVLENLDTAVLYKHWKTEPQPRNLAHVCNALGIDAWYTHNAGNDARYTLEVLVKLLIEARLAEDEGYRKRDPGSKGVVEDEFEVKHMARLDERMDNARLEVQQQINAPFREPEISMEEQIRRYNEAQGVDSASAIW